MDKERLSAIQDIPTFNDGDLMQKVREESLNPLIERFNTLEKKPGGYFYNPNPPEEGVNLFAKVTSGVLGTLADAEAERDAYFTTHDKVLGEYNQEPRRMIVLQYKDSADKIMNLQQSRLLKAGTADYEWINTFSIATDAFELSAHSISELRDGSAVLRDITANKASVTTLREISLEADGLSGIKTKASRANISVTGDATMNGNAMINGNLILNGTPVVAPGTIPSGHYNLSEALTDAEVKVDSVTKKLSLDCTKVKEHFTSDNGTVDIKVVGSGSGCKINLETEIMHYLGQFESQAGLKAYVKGYVSRGHKLVRHLSEAWVRRKVVISQGNNTSSYTIWGWNSDIQMPTDAQIDDNSNWLFNSSIAGKGYSISHVGQGAEEPYNLWTPEDQSTYPANQYFNQVIYYTSRTPDHSGYYTSDGTQWVPLFNGETLQKYMQGDLDLTVSQVGYHKKLNLAFNKSKLAAAMQDALQAGDGIKLVSSADALTISAGFTISGMDTSNTSQTFEGVTKIKFAGNTVVSKDVDTGVVTITNSSPQNGISAQVEGGTSQTIKEISITGNTGGSEIVGDKLTIELPAGGGSGGSIQAQVLNDTKQNISLIKALNSKTKVSGGVLTLPKLNARNSIKQVKSSFTTLRAGTNIGFTPYTGSEESDEESLVIECTVPKGDTGPQGPQGPAGKDGASVHFKGKVDSYNDLATQTTAVEGDCYYIDSTTDPKAGHLYALGTGSPTDLANWTDLGKVQGTQGPMGPQGIQGPEGPKGDKGDKGDLGSLEVDVASSSYTDVAKLNFGDGFTASWDGTQKAVTIKSDGSSAELTRFSANYPAQVTGEDSQAYDPNTAEQQTGYTFVAKSSTNHPLGARAEDCIIHALVRNEHDAQKNFIQTLYGLETGAIWTRFRNANSAQTRVSDWRHVGGGLSEKHYTILTPSNGYKYRAFKDTHMRLHIIQDPECNFLDDEKGGLQIRNGGIYNITVHVTPTVFRPSGSETDLKYKAIILADNSQVAVAEANARVVTVNNIGTMSHEVISIPNVQLDSDVTITVKIGVTGSGLDTTNFDDAMFDAYKNMVIIEPSSSPTKTGVNIGKNLRTLHSGIAHEPWYNVRTEQGATGVVRVYGDVYDG